jgi:predicted amidohydrolase
MAISEFTIAAAQCSAKRGEVAQNVATHVHFVEEAASCGVNLLIFPELSLTGYELDLAATHQLHVDDPRLDSLVAAARHHGVHVLVGAPCPSGSSNPYLGGILVSPATSACYAKIHVHESEQPYFVAGSAHVVAPIEGVLVGLAICADTFYEDHAKWMAESGAQAYVAAVMKTEVEFPYHEKKMARYAERHAMLTLTANYAGSTGGAVSAGRSAIWGPDGEILAQANENMPALVIAQRHGPSWSGEVVAMASRS